ncbi:acid phosphatase [Pandoraea terrae]|uniref:phospholipase C n=1 Tax=Pandoraea terrae TaxID=1537710 RepID=A0A5E4V972_9BURK|nr:acid phosphatase [Pandoraea terrae]VVE07420.1 acid phosphatase [Pandoraea terrae]
MTHDAPSDSTDSAGSHDPAQEPNRRDDTPADPSRRRLLQGLAAIGVSGATGTLTGCATESGAQAPTAVPASDTFDAQLKSNIQTVVVIYLENRSFNNLFGDFPGVSQPLSKVPASHYTQIDRDGKTPLPALPPIWGGLVPKAQQIGGKQYLIGEQAITGLPNAPFMLKDAEGKLLPESVITRDLWHLFWQNQMQIADGRNNQFAAWADSGGLVMGYYGETAKTLNLWKNAQQYTLCDNFFMAAFGGSFLNHQFLACGRAPVYPNAAQSPARDKIAVLADGPAGTRLAVAPDSPASAIAGKPKFVRDGAITPDNFAVNTMLPPYQPSPVKPPAAGDARLADASHPTTLPPQTHATIGDLLSAKGVSWAWYAGAWQAALDHKGGADTPNFQYHHQPFNYFAQFAPGTSARETHLRDAGLGDSPISNRFLGDAIAGKLPAVTFYKPQGNLNQHAGYSDVESGDQHVANVLAHLMKSPQWRNMMVVITYDENGGWWDHVAPPKGDRWGPGSRVPALVVSPFSKQGVVDHTLYDTTSILRFLTRRFDLPLLEGLAERNAAFAARGAAPPGDLTPALRFA